MKKSYLILSVLLGIVVFFTIAFSVFKSSKAVSDAKKEVIFSAEYEYTHKKFMAIKVIDFKDSLKAIDAFGVKLKKGEWYLQCNANRVLFPIIPGRRSDNIMIFGSDQIEILNFPLSPKIAKKVKMNAVINNGTPMGIDIDAEILLLGEYEITTNPGSNYQELSFKR